MKDNPLLDIQALGQSIWQDFISREVIRTGALRRRIEEEGLRGVTSNPAIFNEAIGGSQDYDDDIRELARQGKSTVQIYETLTVGDVGDAADLLRPLYDESEGRHGFVSLEVNPHLARDIDGTLSEAHHLWQTVDRPNVMIKVPATREGLTCIEQLIRDGINVNVTLLFGLPRYREVAQAYIAGLTARAQQGEPLEHVASVASFFLSRIDVLVDPMLEERIQGDGPAADIAAKLRGQVAVASAKQAYQIYKEIFMGADFRRLTERGARTQRVLWASTSTKNPDYPDVKYVEALIGPDTVNTLPQETLDAYRDHGRPAPRLEEDLSEAEWVLRTLHELGIDIDRVTGQLVQEGIEKFNEPYDSLIQTLEGIRKKAAQ
ncbi:MAG: transaldolase [Desulfobacterales bacterium]